MLILLLLLQGFIIISSNKSKSYSWHKEKQSPPQGKSSCSHCLSDTCFYLCFAQDKVVKEEVLVVYQADYESNQMKLKKVDFFMRRYLN